MRTCQALFPGEDCTECCPESATSQLGHLVLCPLHAVMASEGLLEYDGREASARVREDVHERPDLFPRGVFSWAQGIIPEPLEE